MSVRFVTIDDDVATTEGASRHFFDDERILSLQFVTLEDVEIREALSGQVFDSMRCADVQF